MSEKLCCKCHKRQKSGGDQYCRKCRVIYQRIYRRERQMCKVCRYRFHEVDFDNHPLFGRNIFTTAHNILGVLHDLEERLKNIENLSRAAYQAPRTHPELDRPLNRRLRP